MDSAKFSRQVKEHLYSPVYIDPDISVFSQDIGPIREQVLQTLDLIVGKVRQLPFSTTEEMEKIEQRFAKFQKDILSFKPHVHGASKKHYFDMTSFERLMGVGKRDLEAIYMQLKDGNVSDNMKMAVLQNLEQGLPVCAPGALNNINDAAVHLQRQASGTIEQDFQFAKESLASEAIFKIAGTPGDNTNASHNGAIITNYMADIIGITPKEKETTATAFQNDLHWCSKENVSQVINAVTPHHIVTHLAGQYIEEFRELLQNLGFSEELSGNGQISIERLGEEVPVAEPDGSVKLRDKNTIIASHLKLLEQKLGVSDLRSALFPYYFADDDDEFSTFTENHPAMEAAVYNTLLEKGIMQGADIPKQGITLIDESSQRFLKVTTADGKKASFAAIAPDQNKMLENIHTSDSPELIVFLLKKQGGKAAVEFLKQKERNYSAPSKECLS